MKPYKAALIGIGGYGKNHTGMIESLSSEGLLQCVAFADPHKEANQASFDRLSALGAQYYADYQEMLKRHPEIDFVVLATPIPLHKPMAVYAMEQGFHVLTEKPPAVTVQDVETMTATSLATGKHCAVSFQMTSGQAFRLAIEKLRAQAIGELRSVTGVGLWHRTDDYYARTPWAGKLVHNGQYVLDGTINNPLSHTLNNCLIAAGSGDPLNALPRQVQAELYHGHRIEAEDTSCIRIAASNGVEVRFYATLCHLQQEMPYIVLQGTRGSMRWHYDNSLTIVDADGREQSFSFEKENYTRNMYLNLMAALDGKEPLRMPIAACRSFMLASNGAFESSKRIYPLPEDRWSDLSSLIAQASAQGKLFSELDADWAVHTEPFDVSDYHEFALYA